MSKHVDDLIQKSINMPREKFIVDYVHESNKLKEKITELEKENAILKKSIKSLCRLGRRMWCCVG